MPKHFISTVAFVCVIVIIMCLAWADQVVNFAKTKGLASSGISLGDWGDSFSALNTLFSGLAFVGIGATIYLQIVTNKRLQSESSRSEFERTFFQMFDLMRELRKDIIYTPSDLKKMSRNAISIPASGSLSYRVKIPVEKKGADAIKEAYNDIKSSVISLGENVNAKQLSRLYSIHIKRHHDAEFSPYFRTVYSILRRIDRADFLNYHEKLEYSRLLRSQMTSYEAIILGVNGLTPDSKDLRVYIEKFRMLKYCQSGEMKGALSKCYDPDTFQGLV